MINSDEFNENMPKGLDDLLSSIRGGTSRSKSSSALALYSPDSRQEKFVSEQVDERILALLGLEDVSDIDYATYKTLLRERMAAGRMVGKKIPTEEVEVLTNEFKRVKRNTGRFKVEKKKINFQNVTNVTQIVSSRSRSTPNTGPSQGQTTIQVESPEGDEDNFKGIKGFLIGFSNSLEKIEKNLSDMLDLEAEQVASEKKEVDADRVAGEKQKKRKKESGLEGAIKGFAKDLGSKVIAPVKSLFGSILNFLTQIFLGSLLLNIIKFIENPLIIFNPFIGFINSIIKLMNKVMGFVFGGLLEPINFMAGLINGGIKNLENTVNGIFGLFGAASEDDKFTLPKIPQAKAPEIPLIPLFGEDKVDSGEGNKTPIKGMAGGGMVPSVNIFNSYSGGGEVDNFGNIMKSMAGLAGGGMIAMNGLTGGGAISSSTGRTISGMGPDTQLIAAQPGEIVMSKKAVAAYGANNLLAMNRNAGGTNIPTMGSVQGFQGGGRVGAIMSLSDQAKYDVIIPLDHTRKPGTIPDTPGGSTFKASNATGAAGREREAQDPAAAMIAQRMAQQGLRVRIYSPEDAGDYESYDRYLEQQAKMGVRIMPLHFDAGRDASGKIVGTGFLTRTRAGDVDDKRFADPIQAVLAEFQKDNPDLGRIAQDTANNATVNRGGASPTALVELGIMTFWEKKYGKNFTQHPEFQNFAMRIADAAVVGTGLKSKTTQPVPQSTLTPGGPNSEAMKARMTLDSINQAMRKVEAGRKANSGDGSFVTVPGVGKFQQGTEAGFIPVHKYYDLNGRKIPLSEFNKRLESVRQTQQKLASSRLPPPTSTLPSPRIVPPTTTTEVPPRPPSRSSQPLVLPVSGGSGVQSQSNSAAATPSQKEVPSFSSRDLGNNEFIVIKSIYNIVG